MKRVLFALVLFAGCTALAQAPVTSVPPDSTRLEAVSAPQATYPTEAVKKGVQGDAVKQWRYRTCYLNGVPVEVESQATINFTLAAY